MLHDTNDDVPFVEHGFGCWLRGPKHYECALQRIKLLQDALAIIRTNKLPLYFCAKVADSALHGDQYEPEQRNGGVDETRAADAGTVSGNV